MKKIIILILLFISIISFSQNKEYKYAKTLYKAKLFTEANTILDKILNNEYGVLYKEGSGENRNLQGLFEIDCWDLKKECLLKLKDYKAAYISAEKHNALFRQFVGNTEGFNEYASEELKTIKSLIENEIKQVVTSTEEKKSDNTKLDTKDIKETKIAETLSTSNNASISSTTTISKSGNRESNNSETAKSTSDDKTVTLTVSGTGKTLEEARLNGLRSAIEQAFGAFISSKTEILNDNLVKDEIVSVASGNVEKYDIVSQIEIPNNGFAITLNATVSISKLTLFAQSKGLTVEFKGGMFAMNIKLKELNEKAEYKAVRNLSATSLEMLQESYDYNLTVSEPKFESENKNYKINFRISTVENKNYQSFINYFISTIKKIALTEAEASEIKSTGKETYSFIIDGKLYQLRSIYSMLYLHHFFIGASLITTNSSGIFTDSGEIIKIRSRAESIINAKINNDRDLIILFEDVTTDNKDYYSSDKFLSSDWTLFQDYKDLNERSELTLNSKFKPTDVCFNKKFSLTELEKISSFSIKKIGFFDFIKNRNIYVMNFNRNDNSNEVFRDQNGEIIKNPDTDDLYTYESCKY